MNVSNELICRVAAECRKSFQGIYPKGFDFYKMAKEFTSADRAREEIGRVEDLLSTSLENKQMLDIGSGYGTIVAAARMEFGCRAIGIEPGDQFSGTITISRAIHREIGMQANYIVNGVGEFLPFPDNVFDIVYSSNVLEHVQDPFRTLTEAVRVLKNGGFLIFVIPNYGSLWEGHYETFLLPRSPKWLVKWQVSFLRRDPSFVDTLNFITFGQLRKMVSRIAYPIEVLGYGQKIWEDRIRSLEFSEWGGLRKVKMALRALHAIKAISLFIRVGRWLHWETPFVLVVRKK